MDIVNNSLRPQVMWLVAICVAVAAAPWLSGGQLPLALLLSGTAMLLGGLMLWRQPTVRNFRGGPLSWYYWAYVGWGIASLLWSVNKFSTILWLIPLAIAGIAFRLAYTASGVPEGREAIIRLYLASAIVFCIYGLWLYFTGSYERLTGSFYWANPAAAYLMPAIIITIHRALRSNWRIWAPLAAVLTATFLLTDSRAASLVLAVMMVIYLVLIRPPKSSWITLVLTLFGAFLLTIAAVQIRHFVQPHAASTSPGGRFSEAASGESKSGNDRISYLIAGYKIWLTAPIAGTGAGTYGDEHPAYQTSPLNASTSEHNYYAQAFPELGLIGFVLLCGILISLPLGLLRGYTESPENLVLILGAGALLLHFGLDIDAKYPSLLVLLAVLLGLSYTQSYRDWTKFGWKVPAASVVILVPIISYYLGNSWAIRGAVSQSDNEYSTAAEYFAQATNGLTYNPDWLNAEGINHYAVAASGGRSAQVESEVALNLAHVAQRQDPRDGQNYQLEGRVLMLQQKYADAAKAFETALQLDPYDHPEYALDLVYAQVAMGQSAKAIDTAKVMIAKYPPGVTSNRSIDESVRPNLASLSAYIGNYYLNQRNIAAAQAAATQALTYDPKSLKARALQHQIDLKRAAQ